MNLNSYKKGSFSKSQNFPRKIKIKMKNVSGNGHLVFVNMINAHFMEKSSSYDYFRIQAVLSIEAAVIVPLFLMTMVGLISFIQIINIDIKIREVLYEEAKYVSCMSCSDEGVDGEYIYARVLDKLSLVSKSYLIDNENGGIDISSSEYVNPEILVLESKLHIKIPFMPSKNFRYTFTERAVTHMWTGYQYGLNGCDYRNEIVYITSGSEVYHRSIDCSHIRLSIHEANPDEIDLLRNNSGERYTNCNICHSKKTDMKMYITTDGNKFHNTLSCSGLKRTIRAVRLSSVNNRRACLRCGY